MSAKDLVRSYGERVVLDGVSLAIESGERIGLVGMNGSGKSTLARILAGLEEAESGQLARGRDLRLQYLEQVPRLDGEQTALEVVLSGLAAWSVAVARHDELSAAIAAAGQGAGQGESGAELDALLVQQSEAAAEVERLGGWQLRHQAEAMLGHLGIARTGQKVGTMSGGERRRVAMARLLVSAPDVAILDEPTNHLDIPTIEWLERYLATGFKGALLLITHDRYLLDNVVTRTLEIEDGVLHSYTGGWHDYLTARAERLAQAERVAANRRNLLRRELEWMRRQPKARTGKQKARMDRAQAVVEAAPTQQRKGSATIRVETARSGNTVLDVEGLAVAVAGRTLIEDLTLRLGKGERVGIVGKNGSGKTSLLRVLIGELEPAGGKVALGKSTRPAYLDQSRGGLDEDETVFDSVAQGRSFIRIGKDDVSIHSYLERFLFRSAEQKKRVSILSGGERARVALARALRDATNLVILDEPTNDLDVTTLAAVEESLLGFGGTALIVTHDRYFLDRVATSILALEPPDDDGPNDDDGDDGPSRAVHVVGNYQRYLDFRSERERERKAARKTGAGIRKSGAAKSRQGAPGAEAGKSSTKARAKKLTFREQKELEGMLERIDVAETEVAELEATLDSPGFYELDHAAQAEFLATLAEKKQTAEALVERWAELESRNPDSG